jgi:transposase
MEISSVVKTSGAEEQTATIFVALELSKNRWLVAVHSPIADKISRHGVAGGDTSALLALISRYRRQVEEHLKRPVRVFSCYEAGYDGFWLHRLLQANGIENHVMDPASLPVDRRARRAKTDRLDLGALLRALMAWQRGEQQVCRMVRVPSAKEEDLRRQTRERERLIRERTQHMNRIKGLLMTQGIRDFEPGRRNWREQLAARHTGDGRDIPKALKAEIERECERLQLVMDMIRKVEAERDALTAHDNAGQVGMLTRLGGIAAISAHVLVNEVFHRAFANRRQVAAYCGLTSSPYNSGATIRDQGISRAGNRRARCTAVELAWLWLRYQPESRLCPGGSMNASARPAGASNAS